MNTKNMLKVLKQAQFTTRGEIQETELRIEEIEDRAARRDRELTDHEWEKIEKLREEQEALLTFDAAAQEMIETIEEIIAGK